MWKTALKYLKIVMPRVNVNGINLYYEVSGSGSSVVLCHGYTGSHQDWMFQVPVLAQEYQVVTVDHRGHGTSDAPSSADTYSIPTLSDDLCGLLNYLDIAKCCLVGHSMGGLVALQLTLDQPHIVSSLVLVDTASGSVNIPGHADRRAKLLEIARTDGMEAVFEYDTRRNPSSLRRFERYPRLVNMSKQRILEMPVDGYVYMGQALSQCKDLTGRLKEISVPTLVMVGEEDFPFQRPSRILSEGIPNAQLCVIPRALHCPHEEEPETFNQILLEFLSHVVPS
jgi:3-oxoadipate enol-lactonase